MESSLGPFGSKVDIYSPRYFVTCRSISRHSPTDLQQFFYLLRMLEVLGDGCHRMEVSRIILTSSKLGANSLEILLNNDSNQVLGLFQFFLSRLCPLGPAMQSSSPFFTWMPFFVPFAMACCRRGPARGSNWILLHSFIGSDECPMEEILLRRVGLLAVTLQRLKPVSNSTIYFIFDALWCTVQWHFHVLCIAQTIFDARWKNSHL